MSQQMPATMQAWFCTGYGDAEVLQMRTCPVPQPGAGEILLQVHASSVSSGDVRIRRADFPPGMGWLARLMFGWRRPRKPILGADVVGEVKLVGSKVINFKPGDAVVAMTGSRFGAYAQYCVIAAGHCSALKPAGLSFTEAAALPFGGLTAMHFLEKAQLQANERMLVIGASGAVGSMLVQIGRLRGANITTLTSQRNVALMLELGADQALAYDEGCDPLPLQPRFDLVVDTVAASSFRASVPLLQENGRYIAVAGGLMDMFSTRQGSKRCISGPSAERSTDLWQLLQWAAQGEIRPVIDQIYQADALPAAHRYGETGRKRGAVVLSWPTPDQPISAT